MFVPTLVGGGWSQLVEPVAMAKDSGKRGGKNKKGNDNDGVGPFKKKDYPIAERARPLVLPKNMGELTPSLDIAQVSILGQGATGVGVGVGFEYGLANTVEVGVATGVAVSPEFDWSRSLLLSGHYLAYDSKLLDVAPGVTIPLTFVDGAGVGVGIDVSTRYLLRGSKFFFRFGDQAATVNVSPDFSFAINANGGVGYQFSPKFVGILDTSVFSLLLAPEAQVTGLWDVFQFNITGQYTINRQGDIGARLGYANIIGVDEEYSLFISGFGRIRF